MGDIPTPGGVQMCRGRNLELRIPEIFKTPKFLQNNIRRYPSPLSLRLLLPRKQTKNTKQVHFLRLLFSIDPFRFAMIARSVLLLLLLEATFLQAASLPNCTEFECTIDIPSLQCAPGWTVFRENCYKVNVEPLSFDDAEMYCVGKRGHLASIHDEAENRFVHHLLVHFEIDDLAWIGRFSPPREFDYRWTDESESDYANWAMNHPQDKFKCTAINSNKWFTFPCDELVPSVCKDPSRS
ncbi:hypothetical protein L596_028413 [Steinernema carpocapsae]|uniref:C-type lectin domain-containing protein n=1 Tax=Steinernema carpocapsae TaxID=34508 RepID=A0A4U5LYD9_STECR|nr:hypothetical protein L596_028413 [Steinernema carpocapsae]